MDIRPSDLPLLVSLDALLEEKNVTRAAAKLHMSQPALSAQLARLRLLFKDPLLVPSETGRGMVATKKAVDLAAPLREALARLGTIGARTQAFDPQRSATTFRIVGNSNAIATLGQRLVHSIQEQGNPALRISLASADADRSLQQFESGDVDLLLGPAMAIPDALKMRRLTTDRYVMAQRRHHPRGTGPLTLESYCSLNHVLVSGSGRFNGMMDEHLKKREQTRRVSVVVPGYDMVPGILDGTDLVATLPVGFLQAFDGRFDTFELPLDIPESSLAMAWHSRSDKDPAHRWLRDTLVHACQCGTTGNC
ncbi:LysR family transcriptional regulator [Pseudoxanthomonas putridarboris]|uniref:LysR family transcriptional regulator n=1 Tax=Pseudoxanthomonas putridarboris TaxID=752605 RepID=A0ABU9J4T1_9GAMM